MATVITPPSADPSMAELRTMISATTPKVETKPATSETVAPSEPPAKPETESEPVENRTVTEDELLPEGVRKRIAKEVEKAAKIQSEIDQAVSTRKAKQAELGKLKTDAPGSEPVKPPQASDEKPKRPVFGEKGHESESWDQFEARQAGHDDKLADWVKAQAISEFKAGQERDSAKAKATERWDEAVKKHGADFPALMAGATALAPEGLQLAISGLDRWSDVAVHLAKNPEQLKELSAKFIANPYAAIATLGRIEASLPSTETKPATTEKPLPEPIAKVGGNASASGKDLQTTMETGSISQLRAAVAKIRTSK